MLMNDDAKKSPRVRAESQVGKSLLLYVVCVGAMVWLRYGLFADRILVLTSGLPLLVCMVHRDRRLLWAMAVTFVGMGAYKVFVMLPGPGYDYANATLQWTMGVINILGIGAAVQGIITLTEKLFHEQKSLEQTNRELAQREEEILSQNEELQTQQEQLAQQNEELAQQNEEIQQRSEEVQQQAEEIRMQSDELTATNAELQNRQDLLQALLEVAAPGNSQSWASGVCAPLMTLFNGVAVAAVVTERTALDRTEVKDASHPELVGQQWQLSTSLAGVVIAHNRTASIADLQARPDLTGAVIKAGPLRSVLVAPLRLQQAPIGTIEVYSDHPQTWTQEHFRMLEWVSNQCAHVLELHRLQAELAMANASLEKQVQQRTVELQDLVNELEHFSYTITHDLRAPLRAMTGYADVLAEDHGASLDPQARGYLKSITTASGRMDRLITDALSYTKAVRMEAEMTSIDARALLVGMIDSYPHFRSPRAEIELSGDWPRVWANEAALTQCFSNLVGNAVKFVPKGKVPRVQIHAERRGSIVRIDFVDNGIGIPDDMRSRVFVMFQRLSKDYEGTGIGLALVRKVVERMGGKVGVESTLGVGSRFWIELKPADRS